MTSYLVYSTVALKWNRKIQCGNRYIMEIFQIWIIAKRSNQCPFGGWFLESLQQT